MEAGLLGLTLSLPLGIMDLVLGDLLDPQCGRSGVSVGFLCFLKYVLTRMDFKEWANS